MNKIDIARLKELAAKATPGPWKAGGGNGVPFDVEANIYGRRPIYVGQFDHEADAAYIAAASPDVVLALVEKMERLETEAEWLATQLLCCTDDNRVDTCKYLDCRHLCMNAGTGDDWREAARKAVEEQCRS